jgi:hypothetical protein
MFEILEWENVCVGGRHLVKLWVDYQLNPHKHTFGLDDLKKFRALDPPAPWFKYTCTDSDKETIAWLREQTPPCPWGEAMSNTIRRKDRDMVTFLRSFDPPCPWGGAYPSAPDLDTLKWIRSMYCPWGADTCGTILGLTRGGPGLGRWGPGFEETVVWLRSQNPPCPWGSMSYGPVIQAKSLDAVKVLHSLGCPMGPDITAMAASAGDTEILEWLIEQGCDWSYNTCHSAKDRETVLWLRARDPPCPWGFMSCEFAARFAPRMGDDGVGGVDWIRSLYPECPFESVYGAKFIY